MMNRPLGYLIWYDVDHGPRTMFHSALGLEWQVDEASGGM